MSHSSPESQNQSSAPLVSTLARDPDMVELVQFFVEEIDDRINTIQTTSRANDIVGLRTIAHQLKGAATGYGFEPISQTAGQLEHLIDSIGALEVTQDIQQQVDELIGLCQRASA
ncbi:MAG: Hpt domain-containing protein [Phycisphaeraceae bacterium]